MLQMASSHFGLRPFVEKQEAEKHRTIVAPVKVSRSETQLGFPTNSVEIYFQAVITSAHHGKLRGVWCSD
jgi:hypothetical protein